MLKAGTAQVDISPKSGVQLAGYPHCPRPNGGIHDLLYAACLYLDDGKTRKAFVTLDLLSIGKQLVTKIRKLFPGIDITFTVSHTHSGPWASEPLASEKAEGIECNKDYLGFLENALADLIKKASNNTFSASMGTNVGICGAEHGIGGNRHGPDGICDPSVNVLAVKDGRGVVRAVLCNYALHPTYLHAENILVSADYPGYIRSYVGSEYPQAVFLFAQGASGDQSSRYFRSGQNFDEAARAGAALGAAVCDCVRDMRFDSQITITAENFEIADLPMKKYPPKDAAQMLVKEREAKFEAAKASGDYLLMRNAELELFGAQNTYYFSLMAENNYVSPEFPCEVQVITVGNTHLVAVQGELFTEYGLQIKKILGGKVFVFSVSNGYLPGYLYTPQAEKAGSYEAGTSMFAGNAGEVLVKKIEEKLHNV